MGGVSSSTGWSRIVLLLEDSVSVLKQELWKQSESAQGSHNVLWVFRKISDALRRSQERPKIPGSSKRLVFVVFQSF